MAFGRLLLEPCGWIVDAERPGVDPSIPVFRRMAGNDLTRLFAPHHLAIARVLHATGRVPSWDPRGFGGRPLVGNPQAGLWYPPVWLVWITREPALFGWITLAHLIGGLIGMVALARGIGLRIGAAAFAGVVFALNPYVIAQVQEGHLPQVWAACWVPAIVCAARAWAGGDLRGALAFVPMMALCALTGHPQVPYLLVLGLSLWFVADRVISRMAGDRDMDLRRMLNGGMYVIVPVALTAVSWLPQAMAEPWTLARARGQSAEVDRYAVGLANLGQLLDPLWLGGPADYRGPGTYWETQIGPGGTVLVLILAACFLGARRRRSLLAGLLLIWVVGVWLAAGRGLGLTSVLSALLPGMGRFRVPGRLLFLVAPAIGLLAAIGFESIGRHGRTGRRVAVLLGGLAMLHLAFEGWLILRVAPPSAVLQPDPAMDLLRAHAPEIPFRVRARDALFPDLQAALLGVEKTNVEDWFQLQHAADLYETLYPQFDPPRPVEWFNPVNSWVLAQVRQGVLDRMNVARLICGEIPRGFSGPVLGRAPARGFGRESRSPVCQVEVKVGEDELSESQETLILDNPTALPRAYVVPRSAVAAPDQDPAMQMAWIDPRAAVLMDRDPLGPATESRQPFTPATYPSLDPDHIEIEVDIQAPGLLVVADTWMPGWSATVDGQPARVERGNHAQRVVALPFAGHHRIAMRYVAPGLHAGAALSLAGAIAYSYLFIRTLQARDRLRPSHAACG
jgi:hypothetical protein